MAQWSDFFTVGDVGAALPEAYGAGQPIRDVVARAAKGMFYDVPKHLIDETKRAPHPGLRRTDYTDIPPDTSPDPNSPLGGVGIKVPRVGAEPIDPMVGASLEAAQLPWGATAAGVPDLKPGQFVLGAGPIRRGPPKIPETGSIKAIRDGGHARMTDVPNIRGVPVDEATKTASSQPHLIKAGDQSEGYYVGAPRDIAGPKALTNRRNEFYDYVAQEPIGGDWYDRTRGGIAEVTGGDPTQQHWMAKTHAQWSAGVSPEAELGFTTKENNAAIAGMPVKAARPAQHEAFTAANEAKDPSKLQLGKKTSKYGSLIEPLPEMPPEGSNPMMGHNGGPPLEDQPGVYGYRIPGGTGVNDFRHARNFGYQEADGGAQKGALTDAQHRFLDYETAIAVERANREKLGGRSDWTGEQIQAAPWVRQKAEDLMSRNPNLTYAQAIALANRTIADYFPKHEAYGTHEAQPGGGIGQLPGLATASQAEKDAFAADPRSRWDYAPGDRDAIYSGLGIPGTGTYMRVRPTVDMQGAWDHDGATEYNKGQVARPLVGIDTNPETGVKSIAKADHAIMGAGEALRAYLDVQHGGGYHKPFMTGRVSDNNSLFVPMQGKASIEQMKALREQGAKVGLPDASDTGTGVTMTNFMQTPTKETGVELGKTLKKGLGTDIERIAGSAPKRARVDGDFVGLDWGTPGSGKATTELLNRIMVTPEMKAAFNNNIYIRKAALDRLERDAEASAKYGATREDIKNAREIIATGGNQWVDKLKAALDSKAISLPAAALLLGGAYQQMQAAGPGKS